MCASIAEDFQRISDTHVTTLLGNSFPQKIGSDVVRTGSNEKCMFQNCAENADCTLVIAPEFSGLLHERCQWLEESGTTSLNSSLESIQQTGDKRLCGEILAGQGISTPATRLIPSINDIDLSSYPFILKPRHGAGALSTWLIRSENHWQAKKSFLSQSLQESNFVQQPWHDGCSVSVLFIVGKHNVLACPPASQHINKDEEFCYEGGTVPIAESLAKRAIHLARQAISCFLGLRGFVGVDLVLGPPENGEKDVVIEINPRLTTSYLGLRRMTKDNLAQALIALVNGQNCDVTWQKNVVDFFPNGHCNIKYSDGTKR